MNRVLIKHELDGSFSVIADEPIDLICVCECAPSDLYYRLTEGESLEFGHSKVDAMLGDSPIGSIEDERHAALATD